MFFQLKSWLMKRRLRRHFSLIQCQLVDTFFSRKKCEKNYNITNVSHYPEYLNVLLTIRMCMAGCQSAIELAFLHVFNQILLQSNQDIESSSQNVPSQFAEHTNTKHQRSQPARRKKEKEKENKQEYVRIDSPMWKSHSHNGIVTTVAYRLGTCRSPGSVVYTEWHVPCLFFSCHPCLVGCVVRFRYLRVLKMKMYAIVIFRFLPLGSLYHIGIGYICDVLPVWGECVWCKAGVSLVPTGVVNQKPYSHSHWSSWWELDSSIRIVLFISVACEKSQSTCC